MKPLIVVIGAMWCLATHAQQPVTGGEAPSTNHMDNFYYVGGDVKNPKLIHLVKPQIPPEARKSPISGSVEVDFILDEGGCQLIFASEKA